MSRIIIGNIIIIWIRVKLKIRNLLNVFVINELFCYKLGHYAKECRKRKNSNKNKRDDNYLTDRTSSEYKVSPNEHGAFIATNIHFENSVLNADMRDIWLLASGVSKHTCMSFQRYRFNNFVEVNESVCLGDNSICEVKGRYTIYIKKYINGKWIDGRIDDVLYVLYVLYPSLKKNLFSTGIITQKGFNLRLTSDNAFICSRNDLMAYGKRGKNNLYRMIFRVVTNE